MQTSDPGLKGILPRVTQYIFDFIEKADEAVEFLIKLSMVRVLDQTVSLL